MSGGNGGVCHAAMDSATKGQEKNAAAALKTAADAAADAFGLTALARATETQWMMDADVTSHAQTHVQEILTAENAEIQHVTHAQETLTAENAEIRNAPVRYAVIAYVLFLEKTAIVAPVTAAHAHALMNALLLEQRHAAEMFYKHAEIMIQTPAWTWARTHNARELAQTEHAMLHALTTALRLEQHNAAAETCKHAAIMMQILA